MDQVRGPHTLSRYYNSDAQAADQEGWFDTGDGEGPVGQGRERELGDTRVACTRACLLVADA
jgi:non-ribosomal peptide synthetase component E (peptide arylation enzyme)